MRIDTAIYPFLPCIYVSRLIPHKIDALFLLIHLYSIELAINDFPAVKSDGLTAVSSNCGPVGTLING